MIEALTHQKISNNKVRCLVCQKKCFIDDSNVGFCKTKLNQKGVLYSLNYGLLQGVQVDPIEKKPFYHFLPGSMVPSIGSWGCNFRCKQCLNWHFSWGEPASSLLKKSVKKENVSAFTPSHSTSPINLINQIKNSGYQGIAFTYNEPTVWAEYVLDVAKLAKKSDFFTLFVTNGSWSKETLDKIGPFIDAANVDLKGFSNTAYTKQGAFFGEIPKMLVYAQKKHRIFLELTTLLIPGINDDVKELTAMTEWILSNLGPKTPWHISRYSPELAPDGVFQKIPPTDIEQLKSTAEIGRRNGLQFVYVWAPGNDLPGGLYSEGDTICPKCKKVVIKRSAWEPDLSGVDEKGNCRYCDENLNLKLN